MLKRSIPLVHIPQGKIKKAVSKTNLFLWLFPSGVCTLEFKKVAEARDFQVADRNCIHG